MNGVCLSGNRRRSSKVIFAVASTLAWCVVWPSAHFAAAQSIDQATNFPSNWYADAGLNRVHFLDDLQGFAIGDRGVIWRTGNSGRTWEQHPSGTSSQLRDITFIDDQTGWIVGGDVEPYSQESVGVILKTTDGGHTWSRIPIPMLPLMKAVRFEDPSRGYALTQPSSLYPSGLIETTDGGRNWRPMPHVQPRSYEALEMLTEGELILTGERTSIALANRGGIRTPGYQEDPLRALRAVSRVGRSQLLALGDGGLVLQSADQGGSWQPLEVHASLKVQQQVDFRAVASFEQHVWIAGDPGSVVWHSADAGQTWERQSVPSQLPIHSLHFLDSQHGFACGALGMILGTSDGGANWRRLHGTHDRVGLWGLFHRPAAIPWEMVSYYGGGSGYLTVVEVLNRFDAPRRPISGKSSPRADGKTFPDSPIHAATLIAGGSHGIQNWRFPMSGPELQLEGQRLVEGWNAAYDGEGVSEAQRHLVRRIRQWRPSVIVTDYADPRGGAPLPYLTNQLVISAIDKAADPEEYPEQISELGLSAWRTSKAFSAIPPGGRGAISLNCTQVSATLGMSIAEHAAAPRGMVSGEANSGLLVTEFNLLRSLASDETAGRDLFSGLSIPAGSSGRRTDLVPPLIDLAALQRLAQKRRNLEGIIQNVSANSLGQSAALGQVGQLAEELPGNRGAEVLSQTATGLHRSGQAAMAADLHTQLIQNYPQSPLASLSAKWLIRYYASRECHERYLADGADSPPPVAQQLTGQPPLAGSADSVPVQQASFETQTHSTRSTSAANRGMAVVTQAQRHWPWLLSDPALAFSLERLHTDVGQSRQAESFLARIIAQGAESPWYEWVQTEMIMNRGHGHHDLPVASCLTATTPPKLDGRLDDPIWQAVRPIDLKRAGNEVDNTWPAAALFCHDQEFLYVAIRCRNARDSKYAPPLETPRSRDADLSKNDRVVIRLDIDRDYGTWYELSVDYLGQTHESCFGDPTWNPTWYVASNQQAGMWTIEAAIRLADLTEEHPALGTQWGMGVDRIAIGTGLQSWTAPPSLEPRPENFGLLWFR